MKKREKIELAKTLYGLNCGQCREHKLPLTYHIDCFGEGCWDCPVEGCDHHVHQGIPMPWDVLDPDYDTKSFTPETAKAVKGMRR